MSVEPDIAKYCVDLAAATRAHRSVEVGSSPRGSQGLMLVARARAVMDARDFVTPEDVKRVASTQPQLPTLMRRPEQMSDAQCQGGIRQPGQRIGDLFQHPKAAEISHGRGQRYPALGLTRQPRDVRTRQRRRCGRQAVYRALTEFCGPVHQHGRQLVALAQRQFGKVWAVATQAPQQRRQGRLDGSVSGLELLDQPCGSRRIGGLGPYRSVGDVAGHVRASTRGGRPVKA